MKIYNPNKPYKNKKKYSKSKYNQKGFLAIVAIVFVVILGLIAVTATYQFAGDTLSSANQLKSTQAFYAGQAGLEQAKYDIITNGQSCVNYNTGVVNFANGQYQVTGSINSAASNLNGSLTNSATTIPINNASGFSSNGGAVTIDSELISYYGLSGNSLTHVIRGINGTAAVAHNSNVSVTQNECFLTSMAGMPTLSSSTGKRLLKIILAGQNFAINIGGAYAVPSAVSTATVSLQGTPQVINPDITASSPGYPGSTIISSGTVNLGGSSTTQVSNGSGALTVSSNKSTINPDVVQNLGTIDSSNLFGQYFQQPASVIQASALQSDGSNLNGVTGQTIWINNNVTLNNTTIGSLTNPVILIVNGNLTMGGGAIIYGFVYVMGSTDTTVGNAMVIGSLSSQGSITLKGTSSLQFNANVLTVLNTLNNQVSTKYNKNAITLQEYFP